MRRRILAVLGIHCILSTMLLGAARVWQQCWNRTHREQVRLASLSIQQHTADLQILGQHRRLPLVPEDSPLWFAATALTDGYVQVWVWGIQKFTDKS